MVAAARERKGEGEPFDIVLDGTTPADDAHAAREQVLPLAEAGATWWIESPRGRSLGSQPAPADRGGTTEMRVVRRRAVVRPFTCHP
jgi:hypothetical protein